MKRPTRRSTAVIAGFIAAILLLCGLQVHATTVSLSPVAKQQFFSAAGVPLALGCVYTYAGGTTTFLATYVDSTGTAQNTDPIQLDSGGFANIWITGAAIKFAVYSNPAGGACPGTPGGGLVLQYTVDNITTSAGSGGSTASQLTSTGANPATSGIVRMTKSDTICYRNAGNSANICLSLDGANNLTWQGGSLALAEIAAPSGVGGEDIVWADSAAHRLKMSNNGGAADTVLGAATADTLTNKTFNTAGSGNVLFINGGQITAETGSGTTLVLSTSPTITTPVLTTPTINSGGSFNGSPSIATPAITTPTINGGIANNGTGLQHVRFTSCSTNSGGICSGTANWNATWSDTSYTIVCTLFDASTAAGDTVFATSKTTTTFGYQRGVGVGPGHTSEVDCIGIHD